MSSNEITPQYHLRYWGNIVYSIKNIKGLNPIIVIVSYLLPVIFLLVIKMCNLGNVDGKVLLVNLVLITLYFILYLIYYYDKKTSKYLKYALILIASVEIICNINFNWIK